MDIVQNYQVNTTGTVVEHIINYPSHDYPDLSYVGGYYAIVFVLFFVFVIMCPLLCCSLCCCRMIGKDDDESKFDRQQFTFINYKDLYKKDRENIGDMFVTKQKDQKKSRGCCGRFRTKNRNVALPDIASDDQDVEARNIREVREERKASEVSELTEVVVDDGKQFQNRILDKPLDNQLIKPLDKSHVYLHYTFDNLTEGTSSRFGIPTKSSRDPFTDLDIFVETVLKSAKPKDTTILLGISSPGGYAFKFENAFTKLMRLKDAGFQLVALVDDICASGGYMLASACDTIVCSEYASVGSVGVVTSIHNYHELINKVGLIDKTITTGAYKRPYFTGEPLDQSQIDRVRESVQITLEVFSEIVKKGRKLTDDDLKEILTAKVWYGRKALEMKLVDQISSSGSYIDTLAKNPDNTVYIVVPRAKDEKSLVKTLITESVMYTVSECVSSTISFNTIDKITNYVSKLMTSTINTISQRQHSRYDRRCEYRDHADLMMV